GIDHKIIQKPSYHFIFFKKNNSSQMQDGQDHKGHCSPFLKKSGSNPETGVEYYRERTQPVDFHHPVESYPLGNIINRDDQKKNRNNRKYYRGTLKKIFKKSVHGDIRIKS